jgi:periplasmic protein TonB
MNRFRIGGNILESKLIRKVNSTYPELARRARVQGPVVLEVTIDENGNVSNVTLVKGHPLLNQAAIEAVSRWAYSPTILNGEPIPVRGTVTIDFVLAANAPEK